MTPEAQRIAIAEASGWSRGRMIWNGSPAYPEKEWVWKNPNGSTRGQICIPDYLKDLNAMHGAWLSLKDHYKREFHVQLGLIIEKETPNLSELGLLDQRGLIANATARQRAEAFLRTIGKWEE